MNYRRRDFLKIGSSLAAGLALTPFSGNLMSKGILSENAKKAKKFGLQLYSLRDVLPQDPKGVLKQVASFGYKQIEGYEGPSGLFWGMIEHGFQKVYG